MFSSGSLIFSDFNSSCVPCPHSCVGHIVFAVMFVFVILPYIMVCFSNYGHFWACGLRKERDSSLKNEIGNTYVILKPHDSSFFCGTQ